MLGRAPCHRAALRQSKSSVCSDSVPIPLMVLKAQDSYLLQKIGQEALKDCMKAQDFISV